MFRRFIALEGTTAIQYVASPRCSPGTGLDVPEDKSNAISHTSLVYSDPEYIIIQFLAQY
jgi:hypothetical protein